MRGVHPSRRWHRDWLLRLGAACHRPGPVAHRLGRGDPDSILLARLAIDQRRQGKGLGKALLVETLTRAVQAAALAGGRYVVIDAIDSEAATYYRYFDFGSAPSDELRPVGQISDVARAVIR